MKTIFLVLSVASVSATKWRALEDHAAGCGDRDPSAGSIAGAELGRSLEAGRCALSAQPISIRRSDHVHRPAAPHAASPADARATTRLRAAVRRFTARHRSFGSYWQRWASRIRFYRFFFLAPFYLAMPAVSAAPARISIRVGFTDHLALQPGNEFLSLFLHPLHCGIDLFVRPRQRGRAGAPQWLESAGRSHSAISLRGTFSLLVWAARFPR